MSAHTNAERRFRSAPSFYDPTEEEIREAAAELRREAFLKAYNGGRNIGSKRGYHQRTKAQVRRAGNADK